jgi:carbamate kinase
VICHGNGPLGVQDALQLSHYPQEARQPAPILDVLGARMQGMLGYLMELELGNQLRFERPLVTVLTMIETDPTDDAFPATGTLTGPALTHDVAEQLASQEGWSFELDGKGYRRLLPTRRLRRFIETRQIRGLLDMDCIVLCAGAGGIPLMRQSDRLTEVEAAIDKDWANRQLATDVQADWFILATDVDGVYINYGTAGQRAVARANPGALVELLHQFPLRSMRPKVAAACAFAQQTGRQAAIGSLTNVERMLHGESGTIVSPKVKRLELRLP